MTKLISIFKGVIDVIVALMGFVLHLLAAFILLIFIFPLFMLLPITINLRDMEKGWNIKFKLKQFVGEWKGIINALTKEMWR